MSSFISTSRLFRRLITHRDSFRLGMRFNESGWRSGYYAQTRCLSNIAGIDSFSSAYSSGYAAERGIYSYGKVIQRRTFLGCGDGEEGGNMLSKVYNEKCVLG